MEGIKKVRHLQEGRENQSVQSVQKGLVLQPCLPEIDPVKDEDRYTGSKIPDE